MDPTPVCLSGESSWTEEPGGLQSRGLQRFGHDSATRRAHTHTHTHTHTHSEKGRIYLHEIHYILDNGFYFDRAITTSLWKPELNQEAERWC